MYLNLSDLVVLGKPIIVEDGKHQSLVKCLTIRNLFYVWGERGGEEKAFRMMTVVLRVNPKTHILERKGFIEERI